MQPQSCSFGVGGSVGEASQALVAPAPKAGASVGQSRATVLVTLYELMFTPVGVTWAICDDSTEKSASVCTWLVESRETRPSKFSNLSRYNPSRAYQNC